MILNVRTSPPDCLLEPQEPMKKIISFSVVARFVVAILLLWALSRHQYGYYILLRWVTCGVAAYCTYLSYSLKRIPWVWLFGFLAVLFNPLAPLRLDRQIWSYFDVATAIILLASVFFIRESIQIQSKGESNV